VAIAVIAIHFGDDRMPGPWRKVVLPSSRKENHDGSYSRYAHRGRWNEGKLVGRKAPFKLKEFWAIRVRLQMYERLRKLALIDLGIDSKLRACDLCGYASAT
jgi:hypothetical protein